MDIRNILSFAPVYSTFINLITEEPWQPDFLAETVRVKAGDRLLDVGCGPADILMYLEDIDYVGIDLNPRYIESARTRFLDKGKFVCAGVNADVVRKEGKFDIVLASALLHHIDDETCRSVLEGARAALKPGGRLISIDPVYIENQRWIAKTLARLDRGKYVRKASEYEALARHSFPKLETKFFNNMLRIPYDHFVMIGQL